VTFASRRTAIRRRDSRHPPIDQMAPYAVDHRAALAAKSHRGRFTGGRRGSWRGGNRFLVETLRGGA